MEVDELLERAELPRAVRRTSSASLEGVASVAWFGLTTRLTGDAASGLHRFPHA